MCRGVDCSLLPGRAGCSAQTKPIPSNYLVTNSALYRCFKMCLQCFAIENHQSFFFFFTNVVKKKLGIRNHVFNVMPFHGNTMITTLVQQ